MGKYKHGKPNRLISIQEFKLYLLKGKFLKQFHKAYFVLLYWIGARRTEPLKLTKEDLTEKEGSLWIDIPAFKRGERGGKIELPLYLPGIIHLKNRWLKTRKHRRIFPFATATTWRIIHRINPNISPHWLRHNRISKLRILLDQKKITKDEIKSWTGIKRDTTIEVYGMKTQDGIHRISKVLNSDPTE